MFDIRIPATTANIGPGFDAFGMALGFYNYVAVSKAERLALDIQGEGAGVLSYNRNNLLVQAAQAVYDRAGAGEAKLVFTLINQIPISRGLGSSSAAIIGGIVAANAGFRKPLLPPARCLLSRRSWKGIPIMWPRRC